MNSKNLNESDFLNFLLFEKKELYHSLKTQLENYEYREETFGDDYGKEKLKVISQLMNLLDGIQQNKLTDFKLVELNKITADKNNSSGDLTTLIGNLIKV